MSPQFSIITPVLNMASHVSGCIESVKNQNVTIEHIIVDGGSTDDTLEVVRDLQHPDLKIIEGPDNGQSDAINKGLKMAKGRIFNWLNADDKLRAGALKNVLDLMEGNDVVIGKCEHKTSTGKVIATGRTYCDSSVPKTMANYAMAQPSHFYKTSSVKELSGLNEALHYVMDMDLWFRYLLKNGSRRVAKTDSVLSDFLVHPESKTSSQASAMKAEKYGVFLTVLKNIDTPDFVENVVRKKASDLALNYALGDFSSSEFLSEFCWHLLLEAYENGDLDLASQLLDLVRSGDRLSKEEQVFWNLRVNGPSGQLIKKLRGR